MAENDITIAPYREIPLTKGKVALVDAEDFERINAFGTWVAERLGRKDFYATRRPYVPVRRHGKRVLMSREIMNAPEGVFVDHWNHNTLDNRKANLRLCTDGENAYNRLRYKSNTSGFKGVWLRKETGRWSAAIKVNRKHYVLGCFDTPELAHAAYVEAAKRLHGEFACLG
jgi:AP2 domain/HNH endonuclease